MESFKTQLLRKDKHVNSLELSLTQKNEENEMVKEKLTLLAKQQQQHMTTSNSQSNSNLVEIENLKKLNAQLKKEASRSMLEPSTSESDFFVFKISYLIWPITLFKT